MKAPILTTILILVLIVLVFLLKLKILPKPAEKPTLQTTEILGSSFGNPIVVTLSPETALQGEPVLITIEGLTSPSVIKSLSFDKEPIALFDDKEKVRGLIGIDFHKTPGSYLLTLKLIDGSTIEKNIEIKPRKISTAEFDIPDRLGGNTPQAEHKLTTSLAEDTAVIDTIITTTRPEKLWEGPFRLPLEGHIIITDVYGYKRQTGSVNLSHQGTDFRASKGTPIYAMNAGRVAFAGTFKNYGHTVIIDHGLGLMTAYMHLSETKVEQEKMVKGGELIALSGNTGYSLGSHLHLSIRINGLTIDPMKFLELMGQK